jgi:hypothetical protein
VTRRHLLDLVTRIAPLPGVAGFLSEWLKAGQGAQHQHAGSLAPAEPRFFANYQPKFFSREDFEALEAFTEILIPSDETPGAREAHCAHFIDFVLASAVESGTDSGETWRKAIQSLKDAGFHNASGEARATLVEAMSKPERDRSSHHPAFAAYRVIKRETAFAFYTSRTGMIENLDYRGNSYNVTFPACTHPEHHVV